MTPRNIETFIGITYIDWLIQHVRRHKIFWQYEKECVVKINVITMRVNNHGTGLLPNHNINPHQ